MINQQICLLKPPPAEDKAYDSNLYSTCSIDPTHFGFVTQFETLRGYLTKAYNSLITALSAVTGYVAFLVHQCLQTRMDEINSSNVLVEQVFKNLSEEDKKLALSYNIVFTGVTNTGYRTQTKISFYKHKDENTLNLSKDEIRKEREARVLVFILKNLEFSLITVKYGAMAAVGAVPFSLKLIYNLKAFTPFSAEIGVFMTSGQIGTFLGKGSRITSDIISTIANTQERYLSITTERFFLYVAKSVLRNISRDNKIMSLMLERSLRSLNAKYVNNAITQNNRTYLGNLNAETYGARVEHGIEMSPINDPIVLADTRARIVSGETTSSLTAANRRVFANSVSIFDESGTSNFNSMVEAMASRQLTEVIGLPAEFIVDGELAFRQMDVITAESLNNISAATQSGLNNTTERELENHLQTSDTREGARIQISERPIISSSGSTINPLLNSQQEIIAPGNVVQIPESAVPSIARPVIMRDDSVLYRMLQNPGRNRAILFDKSFGIAVDAFEIEMLSYGTAELFGRIYQLFEFYFAATFIWDFTFLVLSFLPSHCRCNYPIQETHNFTGKLCYVGTCDQEFNDPTLVNLGNGSCALNCSQTYGPCYFNNGLSCKKLDSTICTSRSNAKLPEYKKTMVKLRDNAFPEIIPPVCADDSMACKSGNVVRCPKMIQFGVMTMYDNLISSNTIREYDTTKIPPIILSKGILCYFVWNRTPFNLPFGLVASANYSIILTTTVNDKNKSVVQKTTLSKDPASDRSGMSTPVFIPYNGTIGLVATNLTPGIYVKKTYFDARGFIPLKRYYCYPYTDNFHIKVGVMDDYDNIPAMSFTVNT